jgi:hypothetical protein
MRGCLESKVHLNLNLKTASLSYSHLKVFFIILKFVLKASKKLFSEFLIQNLRSVFNIKP